MMSMKSIIGMMSMMSNLEIIISITTLMMMIT